MYKSYAHLSFIALTWFYISLCTYSWVWSCYAWYCVFSLWYEERYMYINVCASIQCASLSESLSHGHKLCILLNGSEAQSSKVLGDSRI